MKGGQRVEEQDSRDGEELGNDEERRHREVDTGQLDPQRSLSIHSSAFWDLESLKDKRKFTQELRYQ